MHDLLEISGTLRRYAFFPCGLQRRKEKGDEDGNDRYYDEEFHQCELCFLGKGMCHFSESFLFGLWFYRVDFRQAENPGDENGAGGLVGMFENIHQSSGGEKSRCFREEIECRNNRGVVSFFSYGGAENDDFQIFRDPDFMLFQKRKNGSETFHMVDKDSVGKGVCMEPFLQSGRGMGGVGGEENLPILGPDGETVFLELELHSRTDFQTGPIRQIADSAAVFPEKIVDDLHAGFERGEDDLIAFSIPGFLIADQEKGLPGGERPAQRKDWL